MWRPLRVGTAPPHGVDAGNSVDDLLKWAALSSNIVGEEAIDVVLFASYPDAVSGRVGLTGMERLEDGHTRSFHSSHTPALSSTGETQGSVQADQVRAIQPRGQVHHGCRRGKAVPWFGWPGRLERFDGTAQEGTLGKSQSLLLPSRRLQDIKTGETMRLMKGAPQVVLKRAHNVDEIHDFVEQKIL